MGSLFGRNTEIEELRAENQQLREQVENLKVRLRAAYPEAGVTALATEASTPSVSAADTELSDAERALVSSGSTIAALKAYRDRTGATLERAKEVIDEAVATEHVDLELSNEELALVAEGKVLNAVKAYRDRTGVSLKKAKAVVDAAL